jgi:hypothetical protein
LPSASVDASRVRLLNVTCAIGAFTTAVADGIAVGLPNGLALVAGADAVESPDADGATLPMAVSERDADGAGDSPEVASRAPAAMMSTTHATPRMADSLRQVVSFT